MRLLTRSDFDGICCAVLLKEIGIIDEMVYAHPKDLQDGKIEVGSNDVLANVPLVEGCGLWFDHHSSEDERITVQGPFKGRSERAPSTARVIYKYYKDEHGARMDKFSEMLKYVDIVDSASFSEQDILDPKGWILLGLICDPRTGLGYFQDYRISNMQLMQEMVELIRTKSIDDILETPDVKERVARYFENNESFKDYLQKHSRQDGNVIVTDTRGSEVPPGNRFLIYSLYPGANIDVRAIEGKAGNISISVGHSITNRTSSVDVGSLMLKYGGGGHTKVGTCQVGPEDADKVFAEIIQACKG